MAAAGAEPAGLERIPCRAAAIEEVLRVVAIAAIPAAGCLWMPFTERATNTADLGRFLAIRGFPSCFRWLQSLLEKPKHYCELQELRHTFLTWDHFFTRLGRGIRHVFEEKVSHPVSIIGGQLTVGVLLVEPKFSVGILC
jgi:hypothetical protein